MASTAGLASLGTLVEKFQLDVYKKALQAKGKGVPDSADVKDVLVYDADVPPAALLKSLNADLAQRVGELSSSRRGLARTWILPAVFRIQLNKCAQGGGL